MRFRRTRRQATAPGTLDESRPRLLPAELDSPATSLVFPGKSTTWNQHADSALALVPSTRFVCRCGQPADIMQSIAGAPLYSCTTHAQHSGSLTLLRDGAQR